jgi:hypothetical protein
MSDDPLGEIRLRCARAGSWRGLWRATRPWAGIAFLGLVVSGIGWMNLLADAARDEPLGFSARPLEWLFTAAGAVIVVLTLTMDLGPWVRRRRGRPVHLDATGVTYGNRVTVPWERFEGFEVVTRQDGRHELVGRARQPRAVPAGLAPYLVADDVLSLGDVDERPDALDAVHRWRPGA